MMKQNPSLMILCLPYPPRDVTVRERANSTNSPNSPACPFRVRMLNKATPNSSTRLLRWLQFTPPFYCHLLSKLFRDRA